MSMGFDDARAAHALRQVNGDTDRALDWLFSHADEPLPSTDSPAAAAAAAGPASAVDSRPGRYMLHAFVTHLGTSTGCGHYVAHVRQADGSFAYFNDAKVSRSIDLPKEQAYIYIYKRV
jgi:ubiquitin carboxyl-terminal hydrolase 5/13